MALPENEYIVLPEVKSNGGRPFEILRRWLVQCPQCSDVCLVVGAREDDQYVCRNCGHSFIITDDELAKQASEDS